MTLAEYITRHLRVPFCWGEHDCCTFAARWVNEATGVDYLAEFGAWSSALTAVRKIRRAGGLEAIVDARLQRINSNMAKDGDVALYRDSLCLFSGSQIVGPGKEGLVFISRMEAQCAWSY